VAPPELAHTTQIGVLCVVGWAHGRYCADKKTWQRLTAAAPADGRIAKPTPGLIR